MQGRVDVERRQRQRWIWATVGWMWSGARAADLERRRSSEASDMERTRRRRPHTVAVLTRPRLAGVTNVCPSFDKGWLQVSGSLNFVLKGGSKGFALNLILLQRFCSEGGSKDFSLKYDNDNDRPGASSIPPSAQASSVQRGTNKLLPGARRRQHWRCW